MEVHRSARKHGISDADIAHAITHHVYAAEIGDEDSPPWRVLYLGPDRAAISAQVLVIERDDRTELATHAMRMRRKYEPLVPGPGHHEHE